MRKCKAYHEKFVIPSEYWQGANVSGKFVGECCGTKEHDLCSCGGDMDKCDFYPKLRKENKFMNFAEVWLEAQATDKWYINKANQIVYHKDVGLVEVNDFTQQVEIDNFDYGIESIMRAEWEIMDIPVLTKDEAEKKYGIKIVG